MPMTATARRAAHAALMRTPIRQFPRHSLVVHCPACRKEKAKSIGLLIDLGMGADIMRSVADRARCCKRRPVAIELVLIGADGRRQSTVRLTGPGAGL